MKYERQKWLSALLSVSSVTIAFVGVVAHLTRADQLSWLISIAALLAAISAITSTISSHRLAREKAKQQVFLVYAREDLETARHLARQLKERGFNAWLDVERLMPGQVWQSAVLNALEESSAAIVLVSKHLSKKGFVKHEVQTALNTLSETERDLSPVIPVRIDESSVPESLSQIQWVNLFDDDAIDRLEFSLRRITAGTSSGKIASATSM